MALNYAQPLANDRNGNPLQNYGPNIVARQVNYSENNSTSSLITLNANATILEVTAVGAGAAIRWVTSSDGAGSVIGIASGANFDHLIPAGSTNSFVVPRETAGKFSVMGGIQSQEGLYGRVAVISTGVGSVATIQY